MQNKIKIKIVLKEAINNKALAKKVDIWQRRKDLEMTATNWGFEQSPNNFGFDQIVKQEGFYNDIRSAAYPGSNASSPTFNFEITNKDFECVLYFFLAEDNAGSPVFKKRFGANFHSAYEEMKSLSGPGFVLYLHFNSPVVFEEGAEALTYSISLVSFDGEDIQMKKDQWFRTFNTYTKQYNSGDYDFSEIDEIKSTNHKIDPAAEEEKYQKSLEPDEQSSELDKSMQKRLSTHDKRNLGIKALLSHGYVPIKTNKVLKFGKGLQGTVYEVTKDGKRYAGKVVDKHEGYYSKREWEIRNRIEKIRNRMPLFVSKHIVKCFDLFKTEDFYVFIMEIMRPMNRMEKDLLYRGRFGAFGGKEKKKGFDPNRDPKLYPTDHYDHYGDTAFPRSEIYFKHSPGKFKSSLTAEATEEQYKFAFAMKQLSDYYGISWRDLHDENVMIRPGTKEYVATDIGLFNAKNAVDTNPASPEGPFGNAFSESILEIKIGKRSKLKRNLNDS